MCGGHQEIRGEEDTSAFPQPLREILYHTPQSTGDSPHSPSSMHQDHYTDCHGEGMFAMCVGMLKYRVVMS